MHVTLMMAFIRVQSPKCYGSWLGYCTVLQDSLCACHAYSIINRCKETSESSLACWLGATVFTVVLLFMLSVASTKQQVQTWSTSEQVVAASVYLFASFVGALCT